MIKLSVTIDELFDKYLSSQHHNKSEVLREIIDKYMGREFWIPKNEHRIMRSYSLRPDQIEWLKVIAKNNKASVSEVINEIMSRYAEEG